MSHIFSCMVSIWGSIGGVDEQNAKTVIPDRNIMWIQHYYGSDPSLYSSIRCNIYLHQYLGPPVAVSSRCKFSVGANSSYVNLALG